jgi:hypothetical protein
MHFHIVKMYKDRELRMSIIKFHLSAASAKTIKVITKLPNSEQSYKGKIQTHNYINRQNQSTTSVHRIMNGKRLCKSNRPKERAEFFDDFDHCVIKRTIDIIPCFPKRFDLSQIITPIINTKHLIVQNSSIITYFL